MRVVYAILLIASLSTALACTEQKVPAQELEPKQKKHSPAPGSNYSSYSLSKAENGNLKLKNHINQKIPLRIQGKSSPELKGAAGNCHLSKNELTIVGWLADVKNQTSPNELIAFNSSDYRFLESKTVWRKRDDLKKANLGPIQDKAIGFSLKIASPAPSELPIIIAIYDEFAQHVAIRERCIKRFAEGK